MKSIYGFRIHISRTERHAQNNIFILPNATDAVSRFQKTGGKAEKTDF